MSGYEQEEPIFDQITIFNAETFYNDNGFTLECGTNYEITFTIENSCVEMSATDSEIFTYNCTENSLDYKDIVNCIGEMTDITIEGTHDCEGCTFFWEPSQFLDDSTLPFPTILGSFNVDAFNQIYTVTMENQAGCLYQDDVEILNLFNSTVIPIFIDDLCTYQMGVQITTPINVPFDFISSVIFTNASSGEVFTGLQTDGFGFTNSFTFILDGFEFDRDNPSMDFWMVDVTFDNSNGEFTGIDNCPINEVFPEYPDPIFYQDEIIATVGNVFFLSPGATFGFVVPDCDIDVDPFFCMFGHNASWGRLRIWDRWGEKVFEAEASGTSDLPFDCLSVPRWDGTDNGEGLVAPDVYLYHLELSNCVDEFSLEGDVTVIN